MLELISWMGFRLSDIRLEWRLYLMMSFGVEVVFNDVIWSDAYVW